MHLAQGLLLRLEFHQVVETVGQGADAGCATKKIGTCLGTFCVDYCGIYFETVDSGKHAYLT